MDRFEFDDDYVRRLREGDRETQEHFHSYFRPLLLLKLAGRLPSGAAVDDVIQETFLRILQRLDTIRDGRGLGKFVLTVSNNVLLEWYRRNPRYEPLEEQSEWDFPSDDNTEEWLMGEESRMHVRQVLGWLPERDSDILRAVFIDEESKDEVARHHGVDRSYLRVLIHRAKERFRDLFDG